MNAKKKTILSQTFMIVVLIVLLAFAAVAGGVRFLGVESEE